MGRHPQFIKGGWEECARIRTEEIPLNTSPAQTDSTRIADCPPKRRLSPSNSLTRSESELSTICHKQHKAASNVVDSEIQSRRTSLSSYCNDKPSNDLRSIALLIQSEKISLDNRYIDVPASQSNDATSRVVSEDATSVAASRAHGSDCALVDEAVKSATQTVVTDAIETLLRDESHTVETYLKHEKDLSKSSLPGVVPISKQLFSLSQQKTVNNDGNETNTPHPVKILVAASMIKTAKRTLQSAGPTLSLPEDLAAKSPKHVSADSSPSQAPMEEDDRNQPSPTQLL